MQNQQNIYFTLTNTFFKITTQSKTGFGPDWKSKPTETIVQVPMRAVILERGKEEKKRKRGKKQKTHQTVVTL